MKVINWKRIIVGFISGIIILTIIDFFANTNFVLKLVPSLGGIEYGIRGCAVEGQGINMGKQKCCPGLTPIYYGSISGIHPNTYPLVCVK